MRTSSRHLGALAASACFAAAALAQTADCERASTTREMAACAHDDFLAASDAQAQLLKRLRAALPATRRLAFSQAQTAWLTYRTRTCAFEASGADSGSLAGVLQWRCAARMTRERSATLDKGAACAGASEIACAAGAASQP